MPISSDSITDGQQPRAPLRRPVDVPAGAPRLRKSVGSEHTSTLDTVNNLGLLYADQDKLVEAEQTRL
jgi:hypothetical protein